MIKALFISLSMVAFRAQAKPETVTPAKIDYLYCGNVDAMTGATSVSYSGSIGGDIYFNISNLYFGIPYSQQALAVSTRKIPGGLSFKIVTLITRETFYLEVFDTTNEGIISYSSEDDEGLNLTCKAKIEAN